MGGGVGCGRGGGRFCIERVAAWRVKIIVSVASSMICFWFRMAVWEPMKIMFVDWLLFILAVVVLGIYVWRLDL